MIRRILLTLGVIPAIVIMSVVLCVSWAYAPFYWIVTGKDPFNVIDWFMNSAVDPVFKVVKRLAR